MGNSLAVQWLGLSTFTAVGPGSIPGQVPKIPQAMQHSQKNKLKKKFRLNDTSKMELKIKTDPVQYFFN